MPTNEAIGNFVEGAPESEPQALPLATSSFGFTVGNMQLHADAAIFDREMIPVMSASMLTADVAMGVLVLSAAGYVVLHHIREMTTLNNRHKENLATIRNQEKKLDYDHIEKMADAKLRQILAIKDLIN